MSDRQFAYLDSSAFVKLVVPESESAALYAFLVNWPLRASSALVRTEVLRAVTMEKPTLVGDARRLLAELDLVDLSRPLLDQAGTLAPARMRSLDAVHVASALYLGGDLGAFVTYDERMATSAVHYGLPLEQPR